MSKAKDQITRQYLDKRAQVSLEKQAVDSSMVRARLERFNKFQQSSKIMFYMSYDKEILTIDLISDSLDKADHETYVPLVEKEDIQIHPVKLESLEDLEIGNYNILEPREGAHNIVEPATIELVIVPGIAFDKRGGRIGFGKGYYDRFLKKTKALRVALAYDFQVLDEVPQGHFDVPVDYIVTPTKLIECEGDLPDWR